MSKDRSKDKNAATSSATENKDHSRDQESKDAALAKTIAAAVAVALAQQKAEETVHHRDSNPTVQIHCRGSPADQIHHRNILKADGEDTCTVQRAFKGKLRTKLSFYP